jgi:cation diffusion facilitator CzcD-associated flavoprotein CzcO
VKEDPHKTRNSKPKDTDNHFDVIVIGAGISGVGAAYQLRKKCPGKSLAILESKPSYGGTWHTHNYPGVRSDSDMYTFGYKFKPWIGKPVSDGASILKYIGEAISEGGLERHIHYQREVISASWSGEEQRWLLKVRCLDTGIEATCSCGFLWMCQGYYRHSEGYTPDFPGIDDFRGQLVHPQFWPEDLDYTGKRVIVIGSGATAITLTPNMADTAGHITMLQRSPTYLWTNENKNELADTLRELELPEEWIHEAVRRSILKEQREMFGLAASQPEEFTKSMLDDIRVHVGNDFDVEKHFSPSYRPGTQRVAYVPDGDLFKKIAEGKVTIVTDHIDHFTETGILTRSGEHLEADIIITATGFNMSVMGDIAFSVDGVPVDFSERFFYNGVMTSGVPNMVSMFGYLRTSWTMRVDLISELVCRLLNFMDEKSYTSCTPQLRECDQNMTRRMFIEPDNFNPGYVQRGIHLYPKQGDHAPWIVYSDYYEEREVFPSIDFEDDALVYAGAAVNVD